MSEVLIEYDNGYVGGGTDSRNYFDRRAHPVGTLLHTTAGTDSLAWLTTGSARAGRPASADYLITRRGFRYSLIPPGKAAYHAGAGHCVIGGITYYGNDVSSRLVGVELECLDDELVTFAQIDSLAELLTKLSVDFSWRWPYTIFGHYETARPLGRRSDPQGFPWGDFMGRLYIRSLRANVPGLGSV